MSIVEALDLGHGGSSNGAVAILEGKLYREADLVLEIGLAVRRKRPSVYLVRDLDETLTFRRRQNRFLAAAADIIVSLHLDSTPWAQDSRGTHSYHNIGNLITRGMARHAVDRAPPPLKGGNVIQAFDNPAVRHDDWKRRAQRVVTAYSAHTLLLELGYLSNPGDLRYIVSTEGIEACADLVLSCFDCFRKITTWSQHES